MSAATMTKRKARIIGLVYLLFFLTSILSDWFLKGLIVPGGIFEFFSLVVLRDKQVAMLFNSEQLPGLALLFLKLNDQAVSVALVFFAVYCLLIGCLILRSIFLPRVLGVLMALAGLGWLTFLYSPLADHLSPYIEVLGVVAEALLMLWLLVMGVNTERWQEQAVKQTGSHLNI